MQELSGDFLGSFHTNQNIGTSSFMNFSFSPTCRDARNMARDVQNAFYDIVEEFGKMDHSQAVDYIKKLMTKGRYSQDVWS